jgi:hypothetical protein
MVDFGLSGGISFLFADAVSASSACRGAWIAHDGIIVAPLKRVDPVVSSTDTDPEKHDCFGAAKVRVSRRLDGRLGASMTMHPEWPRSSAVDPRH